MYSITINTKMAVNPDSFPAKSVELEDYLHKWLSEECMATWVQNCSLNDSKVGYEVTAEANTLVAKLMFDLVHDSEAKAQMHKPVMRASFMDVSSNAYPTCALTKKCAN